ncbi:MAG TPA: hypothetical protein VG308_11535 [Stellaceae bacterium]|nr:hypothetical protein [Stellaceae bacterium]
MATATSDDTTRLMTREYRAARRLARLFRIERAGGLARRPPEIAKRLVARRGRLVDELARLEAQRRALAPWTIVELDLAMGALAREVDSAERWCLGRLAELGDELARRRGAGGTTGLRDGAAGQLLGHG